MFDFVYEIDGFPNVKNADYFTKLFPGVALC